MSKNREKQHLLICTETILPFEIRTIISQPGTPVYIADLVNECLWIDSNQKKPLEYPGELQDIMNEFSGCIWFFDPGPGKRCRRKIKDAFISSGGSRQITIRYLFPPGTESYLPLLDESRMDRMNIFYLQQPYILLSRMHQTLLSAELTDQLVSIREELSKKIPGFWDFNKFLLPESLAGTPLFAADIKDFIDSIPERHDTGLPGHQMIRFTGQNHFTLQQVCGQLLGLESGLFVQPANPLQEFVQDTIRCYLHLPASQFSEYNCQLTHTVFGDELLGFFKHRSASAHQSQPAEQYDTFLAMRENNITGKDGKTLRYFSTGNGNETIIIINALGLTIRFWEEAIRELSRSFRVIIWETRCCNLFDGGMELVVTIDEHADDIIQIIRNENNPSCHLIGWCNGGRIAIAAATREPALIDSLVLLCPVFRGIEAITPDDTKFEKELDEVFREVSKNNKIAGLFADYLVKTNNKTGEPGAMAQQILSLPDHNFRREVIAPMKTGSYLVNYALRTFNDEHYALKHLVEQVNQPVLLILGSHDAVISNRLAMNVSTLFKQAQIFMMQGASHYIQLQQPEIFAGLVTDFIQKRENDPPYRRVKKISATGVPADC